jgi:hypothetical protein
MTNVKITAAQLRKIVGEYRHLRVAYRTSQRCWTIQHAVTLDLRSFRTRWSGEDDLRATCSDLENEYTLKREAVREALELSLSEKRAWIRNKTTDLRYWLNRLESHDDPRAGDHINSIAHALYKDDNAARDLERRIALIDADVE